LSSILANVVTPMPIGYTLRPSIVSGRQRVAKDSLRP